MPRMIKGLAWDDKPATYMADLKRQLNHRGVELEVYQFVDDFYAAFNRGGWSFVVVDLLDQSAPGVPPVGLDLCRYVSNVVREAWFPVFVVTKEMQLVVGDYYKQLPPGAVLSFKTSPPLMALSIQRALEQRGLFVDGSKVFLISKFVGADPAPVGGRIEQWLRARGIEVVRLRPSSIDSEIASALISQMNQCAAVVAVCTPDDELGGGLSGKFQPRPNVILEIGIALGLWRGFERLIIVRHRDAGIPSDLSAVLRIEFDSSIDLIWDELEAALERRSVNLHS